MTPPTAKHLPVLLIALLASLNAAAQLTTYTSFYQQNWQMVNPAAIDRWQFLTNRNNSTMMVTGGMRQQWLFAGVEGAPKTYFASFEIAPDANKYANQRIKYGFSTFWDQTDAFSAGGAFFNFSYYFQTNRSGDYLHLGLSGGIAQRRIEKERLIAAQDQDDIINGLDENKLSPDFALGVFYRKKLPNQNRLYAGLSVPQVFDRNANKVSIFDKGTPIYLLVGALIDGGDSYYNGITVEPSIWVRHARGIGFYSISSNSWQYLSIDADLRVYFGDKFWLGGGYGTHQSAMAEAGFLLQMEEERRLRVGLSWNFPAGKTYLNLGHSLEFTTSFGIE